VLFKNKNALKYP